MGLIESIKAIAIRAADVLNKFNDPFDDFTRPAYPRAQKKLSELEQEIYQDFITSFWGCDAQVLLHRLPLPKGSPLDTGDQATWHGIYTGILALKSYCGGTVDPLHLIDAVKGLQLHQTVHGEARPRLIRGVSDDLKTWQDDASNDSATGHLFGIYGVWRWGPATLRPVCAQLATGLATELLANGNALVRADGSPTTFGTLEQGWQTDPLRITLALAIYALGATLTKSPAFIKAYSDLYAKYQKIVRYPKVKLWWLDHANDTHRAAIHLMILKELTMGESNVLYSRGLARLRNLTVKDGNVWVDALCFPMGPDNRLDTRAVALKVLSEFSLEDKTFNPGRDNSVRLPPSAYPWFRKVLWNGVYQASQPLPRWQVRSQDFFWQRNLRSLDVGSEGDPPDSRYNGADFLAAYWLSRLNGTLTAED